MSIEASFFAGQISQDTHPSITASPDHYTFSERLASILSKPPMPFNGDLDSNIDWAHGAEPYSDDDLSRLISQPEDLLTFDRYASILEPYLLNRSPEELVSILHENEDYRDVVAVYHNKSSDSLTEEELRAFALIYSHPIAFFTSKEILFQTAGLKVQRIAATVANSMSMKEKLLTIWDKMRGKQKAPIDIYERVIPDPQTKMQIESRNEQLFNTMGIALYGEVSWKMLSELVDLKEYIIALRDESSSSEKIVTFSNSTTSRSKISRFKTSLVPLEKVA